MQASKSMLALVAEECRCPGADVKAVIRRLHTVLGGIQSKEELQDSERVVAALLPMLRSSGLCHHAVIQVLALLVAKTTSLSVRVSLTFDTVFPRSSESAEVLATFRGLLQDSAPEIRAAAARASGVLLWIHHWDWRGPDHTLSATIVDLLADEHEQVLIAALEAVGAGYCWYSRPDQSVEDETAEEPAVAASGPERPLGSLQRLTNHPSAAVRRLLALPLARFVPDACSENDRAQKALRALAVDRAEEVRLSVIAGITSHILMEDPGAFLASRGENPAAVRPGLFALLLDLCRDPVAAVRGEAIRALGAMGRLDSRDAPDRSADLAGIHEECSRAARQAGIQLFEEIKSNQVLILRPGEQEWLRTTLEAVLTDPDPMVREAAAAAVDALDAGQLSPGIGAALHQILTYPATQGNGAIVHTLNLLGPDVYTPGLLTRVIGSLAQPADSDALKRAGLRQLWLASATHPVLFTSEVVASMHALFAPLSGQPELQSQLAVVLACLEPDSACGDGLLDRIEPLLSRPESTSAAVGTAALAAGCWGERATRLSILRRLEPLLQESREPTAGAAAWAVARMRSRAALDSIVDRLAHLLGASRLPLAEQGKEALAALGRSAHWRAMRTVLGLLGSAERVEVDVGLRALTTLDVKDAAQEMVLDQVLALLRHQSADRRLAGVWAVQAIGEDAYSEMIRERLQELLADPDDRVHHAARAALAGSDLPQA
jgi:hypothetical protein